MSITKKPNGQLKNHVIDKNAHARGHERGCKLGLSFFCFLEEINNLSSTFFFKRKNKHTDNKLPVIYIMKNKN